MRRLLIGGVLFLALAAIVSWLLISERSPLGEFLTWHPELRNYWGLLNIPAYLFGAMAAGNPHNVNEFIMWTVFVIQWMLIGMLVTWIFSAFLRRKPK